MTAQPLSTPIRNSVAVADPNNPSHAIAPNADGSINVTQTSSNLGTNLTQIKGTAAATAGVNGLLAVGGAAASGGALSGNPVLTGMSDGTNAVSIHTIKNQGDLGDGGLNLGAGLVAFDNANFPRVRTAVGAAANGSAGTGVLAVEEDGRPYSNISTATTTTVKSGKGALRSITLNTYVASATITIYDSTTGSGTKIATITLPSTITSLAPQTIIYDIGFGTGLTIVTSGATDITVSYR